MTLNNKYSLLILLLFGTLFSFSQSDEMPMRPGGERIKQFRKLKLIEVLDLNEEKSIRFFAKLNAHENTVHELQKHRNDLLDTLEILIKAKATDKSFERVFNMLFDIDPKITNERNAFHNEVKDLLSPEQMAKWLVFERKFWSEVRERMQEKMKDKMPGKGKRFRGKMEED
ncbi:MAG: hypothetical protein FJ218_03655 [Ignavibacteria bacterium]|nr:hypothetical protein [Ignavibacteria bacterium]